MLTITGNLNPSQLTPDLSKTLLNTLKIGQSLSATIEQVKGEQVTLKIGQATLTASSKEINLPTGQVQLTVKQTQPTLVLALAAKPNPSLQQQELLSTALRQHLSNQVPLNQGAQQFSQLLNQLPASLQAPLMALLDNIRKPLNLSSGKELKERLENSGLFMENKLSNSGKVDQLKHDLKAQLLQFKQMTQSLQSNQASSNNPSTQLAAKLSDQMISRITFNQIQLYENPALTPMDLPSLTKQAIDDQLEFRKRAMSQGNRWEAFVNVHTDMGEIKAKLSYAELQDQQLFCGIWCESLALEQAVNEQLPQLQKQLDTLKVDNLQIKVLAQPPERSKKSQRIALVDIHI
ncbi:hypothetical protein J3998_11105 [Thiomicrorhabdus sp. 6S2-11]|uniref:Flagellar hook-length control protein-like C-terminal domain-containing protein n=1 Tax=Thiomicrorhabdus marina TaxID=2818442 RepID=A0ABS3Q6Z2_9GAMM|nr:hypothetical protein [Thiomicrorhabdus marina]MBO1928123.1 hypothetical protein [Thiomicrorhabdus marina]